MRAAPCFLSVSLSFGLWTTAARAEIPLDIVDRGTARITLDGLLRDWTPISTLTAVDEPAQVLRGASAWRGPDDSSFGYALARDTDALYLAAEIHDDVVVRSREHRAGEDTLGLSLAVQTPGRVVAYDIDIQPGAPGDYSGVVRFANRGAVPGAQVVEAPLSDGGGYTLEVRIPWTAIPAVRGNLSTLRGRIAYMDTDNTAHPVTETVIASGAGDADHPMAMPAAVGSVGDAGPGALLDRFRIDHDVGTASPLVDRAVDLAGDGQAERVVIFPRYLVVFGPGVSNGHGYAFAELPSRAVADVLETSFRPVTGDAHPAVLLRVRSPGSGYDRELLLVYRIDTGGALREVFALETARASGLATRLTDRVTWQPEGRVRVSIGDNHGFTPSAWNDAREEGVEAMVTPWGPDRARVYQWNPARQTFVLDHAEPNPGVAPVALTTPVAPAATTNNGPSPSPAQPDVPLPADIEGVVGLFRQREQIPADARPTFTVRGDVAGDSTPESLMVFGRVLLVVGPGYMGGRAYYSMVLPVDSGDDVLGLSLADLTGDGKSEAIVRVRRRLQAQVQGETLAVEKQLLLAYTIEGPHRGRVFGAEISRRVGANGITDTVVLPRRGHGDITIEADSAHGWTAATYPFHDVPTPGIESLILPWETPHRRTYHWNGAAMVSAE